MNRFLIVAITVFLLLGVTGTILPNTFVGKYAAALLFVAKNLSIITMLVNGTFMSTRYFHFSIAAMLIIALGMIFKILHYAGADQLIFVGFPLLWLSYFVHFLSKKTKEPLDILKVVMLLGFLAPTPLGVLHLIPDDTKAFLSIVSSSLVAATFLYFVISGYRQDVLFKD